MIVYYLWLSSVLFIHEKPFCHYECYFAVLVQCSILFHVQLFDAEIFFWHPFSHQWLHHHCFGSFRRSLALTSLAKSCLSNSCVCISLFYISLMFNYLLNFHFLVTPYCFKVLYRLVILYHFKISMKKTNFRMFRQQLNFSTYSTINTDLTFMQN